MARPRKNDETRSPWVVRDVPEKTRRQVRVYAATHDMTMAQAVEAMIESVSRRHDRQLLNMLLELHRLICAGDTDAAREEAARISEHLAKTSVPDADA